MSAFLQMSITLNEAPAIFARFMFLQDHELSNAACNALSALAYVEPDLILPLVHERFQVGFVMTFEGIFKGLWD